MRPQRATTLLLIAFALASNMPAQAQLSICPTIGGTYSVYVSPIGLDSNTGCTQLTPVKTLSQAHARLIGDKPGATVYVRIDAANGDHVDNEAPAIQWTYYHPNYLTYILPYGADPATLMNDRYTGQRPQFRYTGGGQSNYWFKFAPSLSTNTATGLHIMGLTVRNYTAGGIYFEGVSTSSSNNRAGHQPTGNGIYNMSFIDLGNKQSDDADHGYGAISLRRSSDNTVGYNYFKRIENACKTTNAAGACIEWDGHIHALYVQHNSDDNVVFQNNIEWVTGAALKVRDGSDGNMFHHNGFHRAGKKAFLLDWFSVNPADGHVECASYDNWFKYNDTDKRGTGTLKQGYINGEILPYTLADQTEAEDQCTNQNLPRLATAGNDGAGSNWSMP
ncbi:MAG TPA: hypothetical protein VGB83_11550 [Actinomycetota bacterium]